VIIQTPSGGGYGEPKNTDGDSGATNDC